METKVFKPSAVDQAAALIAAGQLVAFPTETVYGLGADATNVAAVKQVYQAKGRPSDNPLIVHVADVATVERFAKPLSINAKRLIKAFWPGPLTMIFNLKPDALAPEVTGGLTTAAFRNPANAATIALIKAAKTPIVGPSANTSGKPSPTTAQHVLHDLDGKIAGILDDGATKVGVESTVLDLSGDQPAILRPGAVTAEAIEAVIDEPVLTEQHHVGATEVPKAPGMKYKHYAPDAQVYIVDHVTDWPAALTWAAQQNVPMGVMATDTVLKANKLPANCEQYSLGNDVQSASRNLFAGLRHFDTETSIKDILAQAFDNQGLGAAYMNRLNKSAGQTHFRV
ncbi:L-threonylcarbamoyladenylate synthase [Lactiplantibacillus songbeiensis]|uniref:Threonylcarbamoyl-AMP synthase n=1 Tax=Lactiplantibacillus songbeiensis TaxID=2559920 RepID=A0ABW4C388_9LACO|nr:L-threonylcarbamoyladenylate synthase [Lactiplantibacillus songbeiensis]